MPRLVTGVFYERGEAALREQGIPTESIYLETEVPPTSDVGRKGGEVSRLEQERRFAGVETGILMGLLFGLLSGLGISVLGSEMHDWMSRVQGAGGATLPAVLANPWLG